MEILHIAIISLLVISLLAALYQNWRLALKYRRKITPNWVKLDDRLISLGMAMISQQEETERLNKQVEELREEINKLNNNH
jgi:endonuclease III